MTQVRALTLKLLIKFGFLCKRSRKDRSWEVSGETLVLLGFSITMMNFKATSFTLY